MKLHTDKPIEELEMLEIATLKNEGGGTFLLALRIPGGFLWMEDVRGSAGAVFTPYNPAPVVEPISDEDLKILAEEIPAERIGLRSTDDPGVLQVYDTEEAKKPDATIKVVKSMPLDPKGLMGLSENQGYIPSKYSGRPFFRADHINKIWIPAWVDYLGSWVRVAMTQREINEIPKEKRVNWRGF